LKIISYVLPIPKVKLVRIEEKEENDEVLPEAPCEKSAGGSFYCPYRAWCFSRKWITDPEEHIYCGNPDCWNKFNGDIFKGKDLKVRPHILKSFVKCFQNILN